MRDQADELRTLVRHFDQPHATDPARARRPQRIVVSSGKGGVGTTTIAVNLAVALSLAGKRTALVDADLNRADVTEYCHVENNLTVADVLAGRRNIAEVLQRGPAGVLVARGAWGSSELANCSPEAQERLLDELAAQGAALDFVVLDAGSGLNRVIRRFWRSADLLLLVAAPEAQAIMDTYAAIKVLISSEFAAPVRSFVNLAADEVAAEAVHERLSEACQRFLGLSIAGLGWLGQEASVAAAGAAGRPAMLASAPGRVIGCFERLAREAQEALRAPLPGMIHRRVSVAAMEKSTAE